MPQDYLESRFQNLQSQFSGGKKRFLKDLYGQLEEDEKIQDLMHRRLSSETRRGSRQVVVSFDRKFNDTHFSYGHFDLLLVFIDALSGGSGILKPINQLRVVHWNSTRTNLLRVLVHFTRQNPQISARRLLILPYPSRLVGRRLDQGVHKR